MAICWTTALDDDDDGVSYGRPGRCTIRIADGVVGMLASEQQIRSEEIRRPRCIDHIEIIVRRKRVYVRVYPLVVYRRGCGDGRSMVVASVATRTVDFAMRDDFGKSRSCYSSRAPGTTGEVARL